MSKKRKAVKVEAELVGPVPSPGQDELPEALKVFIEKHPIIAAIGTIALGFLLMQPSPSRPAHLVVPELGGRRNSAWRGKGSFGSAPFGKQSAHR